MALARKGTRTILVEGVTYRWTVAPNDEPGLGIVVEADGDSACRLVSWVEHGVIVSPGLVRRAILDGVAAGWRYATPGPDFVRRVPAFSEKRDAIHQCPACDYFTLPKRGQYDICPICFWEDDGLDLDKVDQFSGPNHLTLREGRENFRNLGACRVDMQPHVLDEGSRGRYRYAPRQP
jgi:Cysteine-rich CPCC